MSLVPPRSVIRARTARDNEQTPCRSFESPTGFAIVRASLARPTFAVVFTGLSARLSAPAGAYTVKHKTHLPCGKWVWKNFFRCAYPLAFCFGSSALRAHNGDRAKPTQLCRGYPCIRASCFFVIVMFTECLAQLDRCLRSMVGHYCIHHLERKNFLKLFWLPLHEAEILSIGAKCGAILWRTKVSPKDVVAFSMALTSEPCPER